MPTNLVAPDVTALDRRARAAKYAAGVETGVSGDLHIRAEEREAAHRRFRSAFKNDSSLSPRRLSALEVESLPQRATDGAPSHSSIVTGLNLPRGEVIYTEPWGEETRDRRMRLEEMVATAYAVFHFKL